MNIVENIFAFIFLVIYYGGIYWVATRPGAWLLSKFKENNTSRTTSRIFIIAAIRAVFYAPTVLSGHIPILVPTYLTGLALSVHRNPTQMEFWWLLISPILVFMASCLYEYYRSNTP